ncbi:hypothetical protein LEP1GSC008_4172 [Leptospira kirschneri serovar Bulgarica str. Nikolaevo]|uniref:Uncharacterized protein n=1 Tax=Leptospira kirschneri serovar Bulgarica str. Nikolaevo TaxID=1240687 RepID=M6FG05_9LEPT|nr:hypothetical protein LEP1GSC008_4172 [Leptospira kirschneri serovar Bulgarica str. Nikolaevo]
MSFFGIYPKNSFFFIDEKEILKSFISKKSAEFCCIRETFHLYSPRTEKE